MSDSRVQSYSFYSRILQRYVLPLISPPTPPQLEQDKAAVDASFNRAFTLIEQLAADTAEIKVAEATRTEKLDATIRDVDAVVAELKAANARRETEARYTADQVAGLRELLPRSLEQWKQNGDTRLEELAGDLQSLKRLLENRVAVTSGSSPSTSWGTGSGTGKGPASTESNGIANGTSPSPPSSAAMKPDGMATSTPSTSLSQTKRPSSKAAIPAWQMAAASSKSGSSAGAAEVNGSGNN